MIAEKTRLAAAIGFAEIDTRLVTIRPPMMTTPPEAPYAIRQKSISQVEAMMLLDLDPVLTGQLLKALDEMGHGDSVVIADAHFHGFEAGQQAPHRYAPVSA